MAWACTSVGYAFNWHPLTWLSHMVDVEIFGMDPRGHHLMNVLLHAANGTLLFLLLRGLTGALWCPALVAAAFAAHPLHVESVAWVSERKDLLSTLLGLLNPCGVPAAPATARPLEPAPGDRVLRPRAPRQANARRAPAAHARAGFLAPRPASHDARAAAPREAPLPAPRRRLRGDGVPGPAPGRGAAGDAAVHPAGARGERPDLLRLVRGKGRLAGGAGRLLPLPRSRGDGLLAAGARRGHHAGPRHRAGRADRAAGPYLLAGWLWFAVTLLPVIGIIQAGLQAVADRYTYLPLVGLLVAGAWAAAQIRARWGGTAFLVRLACALALAAYGGAARLQLGRWKNSVALFERALAATKDYYVAEFNLGLALERQGRIAEANRHHQNWARIRRAQGKGHP